MITKNSQMGCSERSVNFFKDGCPHTAKELVEQLGFSRSSVTRHLRKNNALTSVNCNGQYYVFPMTVRFNKYGLGKVEGKVFSRHGNLLDTIANIANGNVSGISPGDIERLTGTNVQSQCLMLFKEKKLFRKKYGKTYYYFSMDKKERDKQLLVKAPTSGQRDINLSLNEETIVSLHEVIKILVTYVRNPGFTPKSIALSLIRRGNNITTKKVIEVFNKYDLVKKNP